MNFRTKIWMLPVSAAAVLLIGAGASFVVGQHTSSVLAHLHEVDQPHLAYVNTLEQTATQLSLAVQSTTTPNAPDKLRDAEAVVAASREALAGMQKLPEKTTIARDLSEAFDAYQSSAMSALRSAADPSQASAQAQRVQTAQATLTKLLGEQRASAQTAIDAAQDDAHHGVNQALWVSLFTGLAVLGVLGVASASIVSSVWKDLGEEPSNLRNIVQRIADGDLNVELPRTASHDHSLLASVSAMTQRLRETISMIRLATDSITTASTEIASGNSDLSARTEITASNLQQTASSMEELTGTVRQSADAARQANQLASGAATAAQRGEEIVSQVVSSMSEIDDASRKITDIITVIDGIAFQTNILALNAAVEAARAGEQGRGFAVVAGEVRTLAQRSAQAAKEIKSLINASSEKVESGSKLVKDAGSSMVEILTSVQRVTDIIGEISAASSEQSLGIGHVNQSVTELDQMTQQNAALVEQSAAAAESLRDQASRLAQSVAAFKLSAAGHASASAHVAHSVIAKAQSSAAASFTPAAEAPAAPARAPRAVAPKANVAPAEPQFAAKAPSSGSDSDWETF